MSMDTIKQKLIEMRRLINEVDVDLHEGLAQLQAIENVFLFLIYAPLITVGIWAIHGLILEVRDFNKPLIKENVPTELPTETGK